jgi:hypothetical protein
MEIIVQMMDVITQLVVPQRLSSVMTIMNVQMILVTPFAVASTPTLIVTIKMHVLLIVAIILLDVNIPHFRAMMATIVPPTLVMTLPGATIP